MKKRLKKIFNKKGVTLVELLVVLVITAIMMTIAFNMFQITNNLMTSIKSNAHLDTLCDIVNEYVRESIDSASAISVFEYKDEEEVKDKISAKVSAYRAGASTNKEFVKAIAVLKDDSTGREFYRLYDFGDITATGVDIMGMLAAPTSDYAMFNEAFYENTSFNASISMNKEAGSAKRLILSSQCFNYTDSSTTIDKAEEANQPRTISFNLLNSNVNPGGDIDSVVDADGAALENASVDIKRQFVILFTTRDFSTNIIATPAPTPTPDPDSTTGADPDSTTTPVGEPDPDPDPDPTPDPDEGSVTATPTGTQGNSYYIQLDNLTITNNSSSNINLSDITITVTGSFIEGVEHVLKAGSIQVSNVNSISLNGSLSAGNTTTISVYYGHPSFGAQVFESGTQATISVSYRGTVIYSETRSV